MSINEFLEKFFLPGLVVQGNSDRGQMFRDKSLVGEGHGTEFKTSKVWC